MTQTHNEYFIEKQRLPVQVVLVNGEDLRGRLFVAPCWREPILEVDAPALLNAPDRFLPMQLDDGTARLVAKSHIVLIRGSAADHELIGEPAYVSVRCTNGCSVSGRLMIAAVAPNTRVLDFLNHTSDDFLALHEPETTVLVHRRHIMVVLDETDGAA